MPSFVMVEKCDGCKDSDKTACMHICPNDLMVLDEERMKAYNRDPWMCWECYNCVKICPQQAIDVRGYADFMPLGASTVPLRGSVKRFKFPIRTTPEGSAVPDGGFAQPADDINSVYLMSEPANLGSDDLPQM